MTPHEEKMVSELLDQAERYRNSLRDKFAMAALQGWLASFGPDDEPITENIAVFSYKLADAMLKEREKS